MSHLLHQIAQDINREIASKSQMKIGKIMTHPSGRKVKIIDGTFLDSTYGRVSNWWTWREVKKNGKLGKEESGYGWA
jgi:hypothetical protein